MTTNTQNGLPKLTDLQARFTELTGLQPIRENVYSYLVDLYEKDRSLKAIVDAIANKEIKFNDKKAWVEINSIIANSTNDIQEDDTQEQEDDINLDAIEDESDRTEDDTNSDDNSDRDNALNWFSTLEKVNWQQLGNIPFRKKISDRLSLSLEGHYNKNASLRHRLGDNQVTLNFTYGTGKILLTVDSMNYAVIGELTRKQFTPTIDGKVHHLLMNDVTLNGYEQVAIYRKVVNFVTEKLLAANTSKDALAKKKQDIAKGKCMTDTEYTLYKAFKA